MITQILASYTPDDVIVMKYGSGHIREQYLACNLIDKSIKHIQSEMKRVTYDTLRALL